MARKDRTVGARYDMSVEVLNERGRASVSALKGESNTMILYAETGFPDYSTSNLSAFITLSQADTKSCTNFFRESFWA